MVNLDPFHTHSGWLTIPIKELGIDPDQPYLVHDLIGDDKYIWQGERNYVEINPYFPCPYFQGTDNGEKRDGFRLFHVRKERNGKEETYFLKTTHSGTKMPLFMNSISRHSMTAVETASGDLRGLTRKLDYLEGLGVTAIWLLPFYPSPLRDDGYDIADYFNVHPTYGVLRDFKEFLREAHKRGIRVITELVLNHTSDQHAWFQKSRKAKPGSLWRDFYVWSDTPEKYKDARIIFKDFETSNWAWDPVAKAYYWHRFYSHQPDLNFDNPNVQKAMFRVIDFWFDMGVDGLRLDAVPYLYEREHTNCENLPETYAFLKKLRALY